MLCDDTMSDRMPDVLSVVIESPNDDTMSRVINPDVHRAERSDTMSNLMSDVLRITDSYGHAKHNRLDLSDIK